MTTRFQVNYRRTERGTMQPVSGSVIYRAPFVGQAIDWARQELADDYDTVSYVITGAKEI
jgi:hypothetical protein